MEGMSEFDKENIQHILKGQGNWFGAYLLRLIAKADRKNRAKLKQVFPEHVQAYEEYVK